MSFIKRFSFLLLLSVCVFSCKNKTGNADNEAAIDLQALNFEIISEKVADKNYAPQVNIYLTAKEIKGKAFIVTDYGSEPIHSEEDLNKYQIPRNFDFAFFSYFAGEGSDYYGVVVGDEVVIYRALVNGPHPDAPEGPVKKLHYEVFKKFVYKDGTLVEKK